MLLLGLLHSAFLVCFLMQNRSGTAHSKVGLPTSITYQENAPQTCLYSNLIKEIPQLRFFFSQSSTFCVQLTKIKITSTTYNMLYQQNSYELFESPDEVFCVYQGESSQQN